jgi:Arc/MetJ-type ribon-helix-helix transcriptional regulator
MKITLTPVQQKWLKAEVAAGRYASVEEAARAAVDALMPPDLRDLSWAKPYLDEARASLARGEGVSAEEVFRETDARLKSRGS